MTSDDELLEDTAEDLFENAPCGYLSTLPDGTIVKVNRTGAGAARPGHVDDVCLLAARVS